VWYFDFRDHVNIVKGMEIVLIWVGTISAMLIKNCIADVNSHGMDDVVNVEANPVGYWRVCLEPLVRKGTLCLFGPCDTAQ